MSNVAGKVMPRPRGIYEPSELYMILDMVLHNNKLWMARQNNLQDVEPNDSNSDSWMLCIDSKAEDLTALEASINTRFDNVNTNFDAVNTRFDGIDGTIASLQEKDEEILGTITSKEESLQTQITGNGALITALQSGKADKPITVTTIIPASGWSSSEIPYTNTIAVEGVTETNVIDVVLPNTLTADQITAYQDAQILNGSQTAGSVILNCWGIVPIIDLPVTFIIRG